MSDSPFAPEGVLVIDKPSGPTSHDVVFRLRRTLKMKRIGHAGTLDPMASGVLVVLLGEATKLGPYLTAQDKQYEARVVFGRATDTLDALGAVVAEAPLPTWLVDEIRAIEASSSVAQGSRVALALDVERARTTQTPPAYSAIQVDGQRSYDRARRGEAVALDPRPVEVRGIEVRGAGLLEPTLAFLDVAIDVSKGYYVRSFAQDLGQTLGMPAFLAALRRTKSGPFSLAGASLLEMPRDALIRATIPLAEAVAMGLPTARLTAEAVIRASQGKRLSDVDFAGLPPAKEGSTGWLSPEGKLIAVGQWTGDKYVVQRGFTDPGGVS